MTQKLVLQVSREHLEREVMRIAKDLNHGRPVRVRKDDAVEAIAFHVASLINMAMTLGTSIDSVAGFGGSAAAIANAAIDRYATDGCDPDPCGCQRCRRRRGETVGGGELVETTWVN